MRDSREGAILCYDEDLQKIFRRFFSPVPGEQLAALDRFQFTAKARGLHPYDALVVFKPDALYTTVLRLNELEAKVDAQRREIRHWRARVPREEVLRYERTTKITYRWPELEQLALKVFRALERPHGFYSKLASIVGVDRKEILRWQDSRAEIPESAFAALESYKSPPPSGASKRRVRRPRLPEVTIAEILSMAEKGSRSDEIERVLGVDRRRVSAIMRRLKSRAAKTGTQSLAPLQRVIYDAIVAAGDEGATSTQIALGMGRAAKDVSARCVELEKRGIIARNGKRAGSGGRGQSVWVAQSNQTSDNAR